MYGRWIIITMMIYSGGAVCQCLSDRLAVAGNLRPRLESMTFATFPSPSGESRVPSGPSTVGRDCPRARSGKPRERLPGLLTIHCDRPGPWARACRSGRPGPSRIQNDAPLT